MPNQYLEINLKKLLRHDPVTAETLRQAARPNYPEIRCTKDGLPIPVLDGKCLHSAYNPQAEARQWVQSLDLTVSSNTVYALSGLGFGYHLLELSKIIPPHQLVVVEADASLAAAALAQRPPDAFPDELSLFLTPSPVQTFHAIVKQDRFAGKKSRLLEHPASVRCHQEYYSTLAGLFRSAEVAKHGGYKILLVSPIYGGSLPMAAYLQRAFTALGHRCEILDNSVFYPGLKQLQGVSNNRQHRMQLQGSLTALLAESATAKALEMRADLVLGLAQAPLTAQVLKELQAASILTAFWFVEDGELFNYWQQYAPLYDHYFAIQQGEFIQQLKAAGCRRPYYLPLAADPEIHRPLSLTPEELELFGSEVSHVGAGYHNRRRLFLSLLGQDFKIWGNDWESCGALASVLQRGGQRVSTEDTVKIFNAARINVNLHSSPTHDGVNPFGDFLNPRTFEIAACGAFQLVDERRYLAQNFKLGEEISCFKNVAELHEQIDFYLAHPHERMQLAQAARRRVLQEHTYADRALELLGAIAGAHPTWQPQAGGLPTAEEIICEAGAESELGQIMQRFVGCGPMTLEDLSFQIERQGGELSRTEALILLLNEFRRWGLEKGVI